MRINPQPLLEFTNERYSTLLKISQKGSTNVTQTDPQTLLEIIKN